MDDVEVRNVITHGLDLEPPDLEKLNSKSPEETTDQSKEDVWDFDKDMTPLEDELKDALSDIQTQSNIFNTLGDFFTETSEMNKLFNKTGKHYLEDGELELFIVVLRQMRNKITKAKKTIASQINKSQLPQRERIKILTEANKEFNTEKNKLEDLIKAAEKVKQSRDKLVEKGFDISKFINKRTDDAPKAE